MEVKHEPVTPVVPILNLPTAPKSILKLKLKAANSNNSDDNNSNNNDGSSSTAAAVKKSGRKCVIIDPKPAAYDPLYDPRNNVWPAGDGLDGVSSYGIGNDNEIDAILNDERDIFCHQTNFCSPIPLDVMNADVNIDGHIAGPEGTTLGDHDKQGGRDDKMDVSDNDEADDEEAVVGIDETVATMTVAGINAKVSEVDLDLEKDTEGVATGGVDGLGLGLGLTTPLCEECTTTTTTIGVEADEPLLTEPSMHLKAVVRVSFIGWGEHYDAWIDVDSDRIARFNSKSAGRRGEGAVRDEIIYLITHRSVEQDCP